MKQGALIFDKESGRYDIRFGLDDYNGGLHCGECFDVFAGGKWKPTRIEMSTGQEWYLVGIKTDVLDGLRVRVHNRCLARFLGIQAFHACPAFTKQGGGNRGGQLLFLAFKKAVILPHGKRTILIAAIKIFLPLIDGRAAPGTLAGFLFFRGKQFFLILRDGGILFDKPRRHSFNVPHPSPQ